MVWQHLKPFLLKIIEIRKLVSCKQGSLDMIKLAHLCVKIESHFIKTVLLHRFIILVHTR